MPPVSPIQQKPELRPGQEVLHSDQKGTNVYELKNSYFWDQLKKIVIRQEGIFLLKIAAYQETMLALKKKLINCDIEILQ